MALSPKKISVDFGQEFIVVPFHLISQGYVFMRLLDRAKNSYDVGHKNYLETLNTVNRGGGLDEVTIYADEDIKDIDMRDAKSLIIASLELLKDTTQSSKVYHDTGNLIKKLKGTE